MGLSGGLRLTAGRLTLLSLLAPESPLPLRQTIGRSALVSLPAALLALVLQRKSCLHAVTEPKGWTGIVGSSVQGSDVHDVIPGADRVTL